jgi:hypothetical protein
MGDLLRTGFLLERQQFAVDKLLDLIFEALAVFNGVPG